MLTDLVPITTSTEVATFGLDSDRFVKYTVRDKIGGKEWHGPCPFCGGSDRFIVSNGQYFCRTCNKGGVLTNLAKGKVSLTPEERQSIHKKMLANEERMKEARSKKIADLNKSKLWKIFHANLLKAPDRIKELEADGIPFKIIKEFQIGYHPGFGYYDENIKGKREWFVSPAFTFPIFRNDRCVNIRCRILSDKPLVTGKYRPIWTGLGIAFLIAEVPNQDYIIITEGEKKALNLYARGFSAIGLWGVWSWKKEWIPWLKKRYKHHIILFDGDNEGVRKAARELSNRLNGTSMFFGGKIDDLLNKGKITAEQLQYLVNGVRGKPW